MRRWLYDALRGFLRVLLGGWFPVRVVGAENVPAVGPLVVAANHGSLLDPLLLIAECPRRVRFLVNEDLYHSLIFGWLVRGIGGILVWRSRKAHSNRLAEALRALAAGEAIAIFPEGTIVDGGRMRKLRPGVAVLLGSGAPLLPVGVAGTVTAFPFEASLPAPETPLCIAFGTPQPLPTDDATLDAVRMHVLTSRQVAETAREQMRRRRRPIVAFVATAAIVVPIAFLMAVASRDREARHHARETQRRRTATT